MTMTADDIIHACESEWEAHKDDCSGFVKAVAGRLHVPRIHGMANDIVDVISGPPGNACRTARQPGRALPPGALWSPDSKEAIKPNLPRTAMSS